MTQDEAIQFPHGFTIELSAQIPDRLTTGTPTEEPQILAHISCLRKDGEKMNRVLPIFSAHAFSSHEQSLAGSVSDHLDGLFAQIKVSLLREGFNKE